MGHKSVEARAVHLEVKADLAEILRKYEDLDPIEILAVAAQVVGMLIAHQDSQKVSSSSAMRTVLANIETGNQAALEPLSNPAGRA